MTVQNVQGALWDDPAQDLEAHPIDPRVMIEAGFGTMNPSSSTVWIPWCHDDGALLVAVSAPVTEELQHEVLVRTGERDVRYLAADPQQIGDAETRLRAWLADLAGEQFADETPEFSAKLGIYRWQAVIPAAIVLLVVVGALLDWRALITIVFGVGGVAFLINAGYKVVAALLSPIRRLQEHGISGGSIHWKRGYEPPDDVTPDSPALNDGARIDDNELPIYSILVPAFHEASIVSNIMACFNSLDYPHDKLDVLILLEEDDLETIAAARAADPPSWMRLVVVPAGEPRTKPRACNFGLLLCRGEYVVIYDAEDRPEADQLRKALAAFRHDTGNERTLACVQASLNFYNPDYNVLTRMFAIEYAQWFDFMLAGLAGTQTPLPLGGTSNHFLRSALVEAGGWDPYNVTEDADLGMRLAASGYRVDVIQSTTWEEATPQVVPWIRQRTRWIKGYLVTAAVNLRHPLQWLHHNGGRAAVTMVGLILGTPVTFLLYPMTLAFTLVAWLIGPVVQIRLPAVLLDLGLINLFLMNLLMIVTSAIAAWSRYNWRIGLFAIFLPAYWILHSIAAWRAMLQLAFDPYRWEKTPHGLIDDYADSTVSNGGLLHTAKSSPQS